MMLCTSQMFNVLTRLIDAADRHDMPFVYLEDVNPRTLRALIHRDWIVENKPPRRTPDLDMPRYKITGRGRNAHEIYSIPPDEYDTRHFDGLCPDCRERPKIKTPSGSDYGYCEPCLLKRRRRQKYRSNPGVCPRCKIRPKHITKSGRVRPYCKPCRRERERDYRKRYNNDLLRRIREEDYIKWCSRCHQEPVYIAGNTVTDYCYSCYRDYQNEYYHRKHNADRRNLNQSGENHL
jgi:hypothetical protein